MVIHAVSRDTASFPHHCVYLQYLQTASDGDREGEEEIEGEEEREREGEGEYEDEVVEYRLVPPSSENCRFSLNTCGVNGSVCVTFPTGHYCVCIHWRIPSQWKPFLSIYLP